MVEINIMSEMLKHNSRILIGIDGLSRSGKTTFSKRLLQTLSDQQVMGVIFHLDDYIVERSRRYGTELQQWEEYYHLQWDVEQVTTDLFERVLNSDSVTLPLYHSKKDQCGNVTVKLPDKGVIIVEGVFLQREEWRSYLDYCFFLECPREQRFKREDPLTQRDLNKFKQRYWKAEEYYETTVNPAFLADRVLYT